MVEIDAGIAGPAIERLRKEVGVRPLQDTILDAILEAIAKAGGYGLAAAALDISKPMLRSRIRAGYSDGRKVRRMPPKARSGRKFPQEEK
jgi:hypothetical protein